MKLISFLSFLAALTAAACSDSNTSTPLGAGGAVVAGGNTGAGGRPGADGGRGSAPGAGGAGTTGGSASGGVSGETTGGSASGGTSGGNLGSGGSQAGGAGGSLNKGGSASGGGHAGTLGMPGGVANDGTSGGKSGSGGAQAAGGTSSSTGGGAPVPTSKLIGWAATKNCGANGTTGGGDGPATVVVTTTAQLVSALSAAAAAVIEVRGEMQGARFSESVGVKNKTLIGTNGAFIRDGLRIDAGSNLIVKNIRFGQTTGRADLEDGFTVFNCKCVWVDHCEFVNSMDGNLDVVGGDGAMSDWVTISWSKFWYTTDYLTVNPTHRLSNLNGPNDDGLPDMPNVTFHHNWWAENVTERMPRARLGKFHVFNNYYSTQGNNYGVGASNSARFVVENNFFAPGFEDPIYYFDSTAQAALSGNVMEGVIWKDTALQNANRGTTFNPSDFYSYTLQTADEAKASVIAGAGVR